MTLDENRRVVERMIRTLIVGDSEIEFSLVRLPAYQEMAKYVSSCT